jgi:hypothetical protein
MAETLNFGEAVQRAGVSRQRLNEAITSGRLPAIRGGGPGKPTTIQLDDLQAWCLREGLAVPLNTGERLERLSASAGIAETMARLDQMFAGMQRLEQLMGQVLARLERSERLGHVIPAGANAPPESAEAEAMPEDAGANAPPATPDKAALLHKLRTLYAEGFSLQAMADRFNTEGIPTLSGRGQWQKGTIGRLLAQRDETR